MQTSAFRSATVATDIALFFGKPLDLHSLNRCLPCPVSPQTTFWRNHDA
jgi:hypothetical protein